jgi:hypothetical protein
MYFFLYFSVYFPAYQSAINNEHLSIGNQHLSINNEHLSINNEHWTLINKEHLSINNEHWTLINKEDLSINNQQWTLIRLGWIGLVQIGLNEIGLSGIGLFKKLIQYPKHHHFWMLILNILMLWDRQPSRKSASCKLNLSVKIVSLSQIICLCVGASAVLSGPHWNWKFSSFRWISLKTIRHRHRNQVCTLFHMA